MKMQLAQWRVVAPLMVAVFVLGCGGAIGQTQSIASSDKPSGAEVKTWVTLTDRSKLLALQEGNAFAARAPLPLNIEVDAGKRYQEMVGFGANITDASAWLIQNRMSASQREALLQELFGKAPGLGFSFTRVTIGASDFSLKHYTLDDVPDGHTDYPLANFSIDPMRAEVLPVLKRALAINPKLKVMASPWSAPAWMKSNGSLVKGTLRVEAYPAFARYLEKFADALALEGVPLFALS